jgi:predicted tellurium resistance membrane protein TerC
MPAILVKIAQWVFATFGGILIKRLSDWIKEQVRKKQKQAEVKKEIEALKNAKTEADRNKAADDLLDHF